MSAIPVILADGNPLVLSALSEVFERDRRFSLVATAGTAEGFLTTAVRVPARVGVIDWTIPMLGGARLIEVMREQASAPRLIVYGDPAGDVPRQAMAAGAAAFTDRAAPVETLLRTCSDVAEGQMVFPYLDVRDLKADPFERLSRRERTLLSALSKGLTNRELSSELGISTNTVKFHLSNLYDKLEVRNRAQAIAYYYSSRGASGSGGAPRR